MPASVYVTYKDDQLAGSNGADEAVVFPLLRFVSAGSRKLTWAYALRRRDAGGEPDATRRNMLAGATLRAMGFVLDANNGAHPHLDFFHFVDADNEALIGPIEDADEVFVNCPPFPGDATDGELRIMNPAGGGTLKLLPDVPEEKRLFQMAGDKRFQVDQFLITESKEASFFSLGPSDGSAAPEMKLNVGLKFDGLDDLFPPEARPEISLEQSGVSNSLLVGTRKIVPNNKQPINNVSVDGDVRHDRLTTPTATLICLAATDAANPFAEPSLAIEVFPSMTYKPVESIPVSMTLAAGCLKVRHFPKTGSFKRGPQFKANHLRPCIQVSVQGPTIHAEPSSGNLSEFLPLLEPVEREIDQKIETINDFMSYSFEVCIPVDLSRIDVPELERFDLLGFDSFGFHPLENPWWNLFIKPLDFGKLLLDFLEFPLRFVVEDIVQPDPKTITLTIPNIHNLPGIPALPATAFSLRGIKDFKLNSFFEIGTVEVTADLATLHLEKEFSIDDFDSFELGIQPADFKLNLPDISLPTLLPPRMKIRTVTRINLGEYDLEFIRPSFADLQLLEIARFKLRRPDGQLLKLPLVGLPTLSVMRVKFDCDVFPDVDLDEIQVDWNFGIQTLNVVNDLLELELKHPLLDDFLPHLDADIDARMLKLRIRTPDFDLGSLPILKVEGLNKLTLDLDFELKDKLGILLRKPEVALDISVDLNFPLTTCSLKDLLGDIADIGFRISVPEIPELQNLLALPTIPDIQTIKPPRGFQLPDITRLFGSLKTPIIPFEMIVRLPNPAKPAIEWNELRLVLGFKFDLTTMKLFDNRIYFFLPEIREPGVGPAPRQVFDCDIFTLTFPSRPPQPGLPTETNHDGYLDITNREFVIDLRYDPIPQPPPRIYTYFPGGMDPKAARLGRAKIEEMSDTDADKKNFRREYTKRFQLELDAIDPALWPAQGPSPLMFRLNSKGLTFSATLSKSDVVVDEEGFEDDGKMKEGNGGLLKPFKFDPEESRGELKSRVVIIDNELREAGVYAKAEVPGVEDLIAQVSVVLRQKTRGQLPEILASMELERADSAPLAEFSIKLLEMSLDRLAMGLIWRLEEKDWDYTVIADGTVAFTGAASLVDDLEGLRAPSIKLINLDLRRMNLREMRLPIDLVEPIRFDILDGMFGVELGDLEIAWVFEGKLPKPRLLACELAKLEFKNPGALEVAITVGGFEIEFDEKLRAHVKIPSSLGIEVALGPTVRFAGRVGWVENKIERFLFASGKVMLEGMPEISGLLKFGTGVKSSGVPQINLVLYGEVELDEQLYPGVVVKRLGLGLGLNNQLAALPPKPSADAIIKKINTIKPGELEGWKFVREGGFYLSIVGSVTLASNPGDPTVLNAYVAQLVASFDTNLDLVAAGKVWLSTSMAGQLAHPDNPAFVGAMVLSPRQQKLELVLESRQNPYVEENDLIKKLLSKGRVRFAFRLTPQLVDFHLAELSYRDTMFGIDMVFLGEYRIAIFKRALLLKSSLSATGHLERSMSAGPGGFDLRGDASLAVFYGGLLTDSGAMAYAGIDASINFSVSAFIEIEFSKSFKVCGKRITISWSIKFSASAPRMELSFRGHIAVSDRGGLIAVDVQVGINMNICGYRLRASGRLAINPELYEEVRNRVAAFESDLDAAVRKLENKSSQFVSDSGVTAGDPNLEAVVLGLVADDPIVAITADEQELEAAEVVTEPTEERWLLYRRAFAPGSERGISVLLPTEDSTWLTPQMSTLHDMKIISETEAVLVAKGIELPVGSSIRIIGASGFIAGQNEADLSKLNAEKNGDRKVNHSDGRTLTIDISGLGFAAARAKDITPLGGMWFCPDASFGLSPAEQDTVYYQGNVERVAIVVGDSKKISAVEVNGDKTKATLTVNGLVVEVNGRVLLKKDETTAVDYGFVRSFSANDQPSLTLRVLEHTPTKVVVELPKSAEDNEPQSGWWVAPCFELAPTWSDRNRLDGLSKAKLNKDEYIKLNEGAASWASTATNADHQVEPQQLKAYQVVFDRRFEQDDPRFTVQPDGFANPPGVLSSQLRSLDTVEIVGADEILDSAARYEQARRDLTRQELHEAMDLEVDDTLRQARAQTAQLLLHRLTRNSEGEDSDEARIVDFENNEDDPSLRFGWLWKTKEDLAKEVYVRRAGDSARKVEILRPTAERESVRITPLPPRQDFVVDVSEATHERGRIVVKLPLQFDASVLRKNPENIGQLQIYRRIGNDPAELIANFVRPEISHLPHKQIYSAVEGAFASQSRFPINGQQEPKVELDVTHFRGVHRKSGDQFNFEFPTTPGSKWNTESLRGAICRSETGKSTTIKNATESPGNCVLSLAESLGADQQVITCSFRSPGLIIPSPYVFSDEFAVEGRRFSNRTLLSRGFENGRTLVTYGVRMIGENETGQPEINSEGFFEWKPIPIFIPPKRELPRNLAIAIDAKDLRSDVATVKFQLVSMVGEAPTLALQDGRAFEPHDFEIWASGTALRQSGFYASDTTRTLSDQSTADNSRLHLDDLDDNPLAESVDGKSKVSATKHKDQQFTYEMESKDLSIGAKYRLFLRFKGEEASPLLVELPILLMRRLPPQWNNQIRFRREETLEMVPLEDVQGFNKREADPVPEGAFSADDLYSEGRASIRMTWESQTLFDGGVELQFRDFDDSSLTGRVLCEVLEADEFQTVNGSFSDATKWRLRHELSRERFAKRMPFDPPTAIDPDSDFFSVFYVFKGDQSLPDQIRRLRTCAKELSEKILSDDNPKPITDINWKGVAKAVENMHLVLLDFEKSPLNFESPTVKNLFAFTRKILRALLVGQKLLDSPFDKSKVGEHLEEAGKNEQALFKLLEKLDQPIPVSNDLSDGPAFLDRETSKRLSGIVRRRLAIANDTATLEHNGEASPSKSLKDDDIEPLPRDRMFRLTLKEASSLAAASGMASIESSLPNTSQFMKLIGDSDPDRADNLTKNISLWKGLWSPPDDEYVINTIIGELKDTKRIVRAAGLTDFSKRLEAKLRVTETDSFAALLKRPHHELGTAKSDAGIVPKPIPLRALLPADVRRAETGKLPPLPDYTTVRQPDRVGRLAVLDSEGMVTIWSSAGEDLAHSPMKFVHQFKAAETAGSASIDMEESTSGPLLLVRDGENLDLWDATSGQFLRRWPESPAKPDVTGKFKFGRFARTQRGVEVLAIPTATKEIQLLSLVDRTQKFARLKNDVEFQTACYDDESGTLAASTVQAGLNCELYIWRDFGKSENLIPFRTVLIEETDEVKQIESVKLPGGMRFVLLLKPTGKNPEVKLYDPDTKRMEEFTLLTSVAEEILSLAIDRRELTLAVAFTDRLEIYDLLLNEKLGELKTVVGSAVAVLHSHHQSYVIGRNDAADVDDHNVVVSTFGAGQLSAIQFLPTKNAVSLVSRLQVARVSNASKDLVSLFHLWQRMGFCVDFAAQDARGELIGGAELADLAHEVLDDMRRMGNGEISINGKLHHAYYLEAEEHDAEFQPGNRVGMAFGSIAIVPDEFCSAVLNLDVVFLRGVLQVEGETKSILFKPGELRGDVAQKTFVVLSGSKAGESKNGQAALNALYASDNTAAGAVIEFAVYKTDADKPLIEWLKQRSLQLPAEQLPNSPTFPGSDADRIIELAHVVHLMKFAGLPTTSLSGSLENDTPRRRRGRIHSLGDLAVQPVAERFLTVPASAGQSHAVWSLPDLKGHRILAAVRRVSRYEPFLRWLNEDFSRRNLRTYRELKGGKITNISSEGVIKLDGPLVPAPLGRLPLVLEPTAGAGLGQRREVTYNAQTPSLTFDATDPWLNAAPTENAYRVIDQSAGWRMVSIDPFHDPARGEGPQPLTVYQYPHSRAPRFSFQIPLDGMRSIYNQISRVRTGFNGVETVFRYFLPERSIDPEQASLLEVLSTVVAIGNAGVAPEMHFTAIPRSNELDVHLFRHERLVSLPELPYFYRYRLDVRSTYSSRLLEHDRVTAADLVPDDVVTSPPAQRYPAQIGMGKPMIDAAPVVVEGVLPADPGDKRKVKLGLANDPFEAADPFGLFLEVIKPDTTKLARVRIDSFDPGEKSVTLVGDLSEQPLAGWEFKITLAAFALTQPISAHRDNSTRKELADDPMSMPLELQQIADSDTIVEGELPADPGDKRKVKLGIKDDPFQVAAPFGIFLELRKLDSTTLPRVRVESFDPGEKSVTLAGDLSELAVEGWTFKLTVSPVIADGVLPADPGDKRRVKLGIAKDLLQTAAPCDIFLELIKPDSTTLPRVRVESFDPDNKSVTLADDLSEQPLKGWVFKLTLVCRLLAKDLPDLFTDYGLFYRISPDGDDDDRKNALTLHKHQFISAGWIRMPWSGEFKPPEGAPKSMPLVELIPGLQVWSEETGFEIQLSDGVSTKQEFKQFAAWNLLKKHYGVAWPGGGGDEVDRLELRPLNGSLKFGQDNNVDRTAPLGEWTEVATTTAQITDLIIQGESAEEPAYTGLAIQVRASRGAKLVAATSPTYSVPLKHHHPTDAHHWLLRAVIASTATTKTFDDPQRLFLQAYRLGRPARALQAKLTNT